MKLNLAKLENRLIYSVAFFAYSGYYAGLAIVFASGLRSFSRLYTVPLKLLTTAIMLFFIFRNLKKLKMNAKKEHIICFLFFWVLYFIKVIYSASLTDLRMHWLEYILYSINFSLLPFLMFVSLPLGRVKDLVLNAFVASGFCMGLICLYLYKDILDSGIGRINLITYEDAERDVLNPLALSYAGALTLVLCLYKFTINKILSKRYKAYLILTCILSFIMFFLGASRGSVIAILLSLPFFWVGKSLKHKIKSIAISIFILPLVIWGAEFTGSSVFERVLNLGEDISEGNSSVSRFKLWNEAFNEFLNNPILGGRIETGLYYPHNILIETMMATGLVGTLILLMLLLTSFKRSIKILIFDTRHLWLLVVLIQGVIQYSFSGSLIGATLVFLPMGIIYSTYSPAAKKDPKNAVCNKYL